MPEATPEGTERVYRGHTAKEGGPLRWRIPPQHGDEEYGEYVVRNGEANIGVPDPVDCHQCPETNVATGHEWQQALFGGVEICKTDVKCVDDVREYFAGRTIDYPE